MPSRKNLTGMVFGRLTVLDIESKGKNTRWRCRCSCGAEAVVEVGNLLRGVSRSCGCLWRETVTLPPGAAGFNLVFRRYQAGAKQRGLEWSLDETFFREITTSPCHYCGCPPGRVAAGSTAKKTGGAVLEHSKYIYNGIDRKDPTAGYFIMNCVPCCFLCNRAKHAMTYKDFISWISNIKQHDIQQETYERFGDSISPK